ncbi:hypothetical protein PR048_004816 [Dryococelus australis]|uniref:Uncharacterized protein n=1 Tax=Dryococelus australis TaxID=614101 RepID=A0ABQ9I7C3_9NEOP|nr:hypothetical protein PR048_004816 [Dryococelus australis]
MPSRFLPLVIKVDRKGRCGQLVTTRSEISTDYFWVLRLKTSIGTKVSKLHAFCVNYFVFISWHPVALVQAHDADTVAGGSVQNEHSHFVVYSEKSSTEEKECSCVAKEKKQMVNEGKLLKLNKVKLLNDTVKEVATSEHIKYLSN